MNCNIPTLFAKMVAVVVALRSSVPVPPASVMSIPAVVEALTIASSYVSPVFGTRLVRDDDAVRVSVKSPTFGVISIVS